MKIFRDEHGGSLLEFAVIGPLLFVILFGIIEFGILFYNKAVITNASREGARFGIVARATRYTEAEIGSYVSSFCNANLLIALGDWSEPDVSATFDEGQNFGDPLQVSVQWQHPFLVLPNLPGIGLPNPITLSSYTVMNYE